MPNEPAIQHQAPGRREFWVHAGWLIDGGPEAPQADMLLHIEGQTIKRITKAAMGEFPSGELIDCTSCTVLPALVDSHVHLCLSGSTDPDLRARQADAAYDGAKASIQRHLTMHLACGISAVRDGGDRNGHVLRYRREHSGGTDPGVRIASPGKAWHAQGRYGRLIGRPPASGVGLADSILGCKDGGDHLKLVNSGLNSLTTFGHETAPQFSAQSLAQAIAAAKRLGRKVMVHANGRSPVQMAVEAGCDSIEHGFFMGRENLSRMADQQVTWVPTAVTMQAYAEHLAPKSRQADMAQKNLDHQLEQMGWARRLGVRIAAGTDAGSPGVDHGRALAKEIGLLLAAGYSISEALQAASSHGATLLALTDRGRLAAGLRADFIAVKGNPEQLLCALSTPDHVYLAGRRVGPPAAGQADPLNLPKGRASGSGI